jgi:hypothetical protein
MAEYTGQQLFPTQPPGASRRDDAPISAAAAPRLAPGAFWRMGPPVWRAGLRERPEGRQETRGQDGEGFVKQAASRRDDAPISAAAAPGLAPGAFWRMGPPAWRAGLRERPEGRQETRRQDGEGFVMQAASRRDDAETSLARAQRSSCSLPVGLIRIGLFDVGHGVRLVEPAAEVDQSTPVAAEGHRRRLLEVDRGVTDGTLWHSSADPPVGQSDFFSELFLSLPLSPPPSDFLPESAAAAFL